MPSYPNVTATVAAPDQSTPVARGAYNHRAPTHFRSQPHNTVTVAVHRFEETIAGRLYLIEVASVARDRWRALPFHPNNFGLALMLFGIALRVFGMLGAELFMARLSLVILVSGIVLFLGGRQVLRSIAFPIGYLLFMIPLPTIVYYQMTLPLELWASRLGATGLAGRLAGSTLPAMTTSRAPAAGSRIRSTLPTDALAV